jgi:hypothetical protein
MGRTPSEDPSRFSGMTVNERLFEANLLDEFDAAARRRDRGRMIALLRLMDVDTAERSVDQILADPKRYGF